MAITDSLDRVYLRSSWYLLYVLSLQLSDMHRSKSRIHDEPGALALVLARSMTWLTVTILANSIPKVLRLYKVSCIFA